MKDTPHIIIVDDHRDIRDLVGEYLSRHGYRVSLAENAAALRKILRHSAPDLIVLDVMMPGEDGLDICRKLRTDTQIPVIFLTALADDTDRILGLEMGADDYIAKPFNPREILARIKAVLRRSESMPVSRGKYDKEIIAFDQWTLDMKRRELESPTGLSVALSTVEFRLLKVFLEHPRAVLTREKLLDLTVGRQSEPFDRSIDNQVSRLRKKIEANPKCPTIIQTHWGGGYSFAADVETK
ncbi:response regulator [Roseibium sp.]|uniref:response regulator n=1 Tax=Roseibium sp. TaxID=1936156 RepID=UPI003A96D55B